MSILDPTHAHQIAGEVLGILEDEGYSLEEILPGLVQAILEATAEDPFEDELLDEVANMLADGEVENDA